MVAAAGVHISIREHGAESPASLCALAVLRPDCCDAKPYGNSNGDLNEAVDGDDRSFVRPWNEHDDGYRHARVAVGAPLHAKSGAEDPE